MIANRCRSLLLSALGIDPNERYRRQPGDLVDRAKSANPTARFVEDEPTVGEWIRELKPTRDSVAYYARSLIPSATWIGRYNWRWLLGDAIAGLTIGFVVVPQAMAYAILARLSPEYGLYTSFVGAAFYWVFGTSKDIVIGTTAVGSLLVGRVVTKVSETKPGVYSAEDIAKTLSTITGALLLLLGLLRLGWLIEFIPYIPISAFITAAAITIMSTQLPVVLGITGINTREAPYRVLINTVKGLGNTKLDAAIGLSSIALLFFLREACAVMEEKRPMHKRRWSTLSSLRQVFVMLLYTFISWLVHRDLPAGESKFRIVGKIQSGFSHAGVPSADPELLGLIAPELPAIAIILIIEHIAIAKSFGRIFNYTITPSQEIVALGAANLFSPFVGGYCCTGSFGASAVLSKAGVRTPLAGLFSAAILVLALYALTTVFYFIPMAALGGLIIHAVFNLLTPPKSLYKYWQLSPLEVFIWVVGVALAVLESLETSIYATIGLSAALLLVRLSRSKGRFMGRVKVGHISSDAAGAEEDKEEGGQASGSDETTWRDAFLPIDRRDGSNPDIAVKSPHPGVFIYKFAEGFNYPNQSHHIGLLLNHVLEATRRTTAEDLARCSDRLWNDPGPRLGPPQSPSRLLPILRSMVLDFSAVNNLDITSLQGLIDLRNALDRHAAPEAVDWHFAHVYNRWTRRALAVAGFGYPSADNKEALGKWKPVYTIAKLSDEAVSRLRLPDDENMMGSEDTAATGVQKKVGCDTSGAPAIGTVHGVDRPFFHIDLVDAVEAAVRNARAKVQQPAST